MLSNIPRQYTSPKWQAAITDPQKKFIAIDGTCVSSLWELKQFFKTCTTQTYEHHINSEHHHIAEWVEKTIGDHQLAHLLRENLTRWGSIIALERHMLRTVAVPPNVARRFLKRTHDAFIFQDGTRVQSLEELYYALRNISANTFKLHQEKRPGDLTLWIQYCIGDAELADILDAATTKIEAQTILNDYLQKLRSIIKQ